MALRLRDHLAAGGAVQTAAKNAHEIAKNGGPAVPEDLQLVAKAQLAFGAAASLRATAAAAAREAEKNGGPAVSEDLQPT